MSKVYIDTLGCAKNEYDSQVLSNLLENDGFELVKEPELADFLVVNTCGFIDDAKTESIERIFELADIKGNKKLVVTGCLSERFHEELAKEMPEVDIFFGVNDYDKIPAILSGKCDFNRDMVGKEYDSMPYRKRKLDNKPHYAYLKIAEGCNNACSFCAIPSIRGPYRSKRIEDCIREARDLADAGISELILIAQDTSQYGKDLYGELKLPELLTELCKIDGIEWIRIMYVYDNSITDELIDTIAREPKICKYVDMPIQHVANNVLNRMRRQSSGKSIIETIKKLRNRIPDIHIRTTLLIGFPGETEEDFNGLLNFVDTMNIDRLGAFSYSDEEGTDSHDLDGKLDDETKQIRRDTIMEHQLLVSEKLNEKKISQVLDVIIDEKVEDGIYIGRSRYDAPDIDCEITISTKNALKPGDIIKVKITNSYEYDLEGEEI